MNLFKNLYYFQYKVFALTLLILALIIFGIFQTKYNYNYSNILLDDIIPKFSAKIGLVVEEIEISGIQNSDEKIVNNITKLIYGKPTIFTDIEGIKKHIEGIDWVESAEVRRNYPDKIFIKVKERIPFAMWQNDSEISLINEKGHVITKQNLNKFKGFPLVIGPDAPIHAEELLKVINSDLEISKRVTAATRIGMRRWNILVDGRIDILLPEADFKLAWEKLIKLQKIRNILDRKISMIDFRDKDRLIIRLMPGVIDEINQSEEMT